MLLMNSIPPTASPSPRNNAVRGIKSLHWALLTVFLIVLVWSVIRPHDLFTWFLEALPAMLGVGAVALLYSHFRFSNLALVLILVHACILLVGAHYTYAEVPLFDWVRDAFGFARNHYDRVGHFAQGFVPAIIAREVLLRKHVVNGRRWLYLFVVSICLAFSAFYEFIEWWVALATGEAATAFLGTQGDQWDTQWDMFMCFMGANLALLLLSRLHDRSIAKVESEAGARREP
jgi:putative membrane protein